MTNGNQRIFVGIDDTDNLESRGTGFRARQLGELIETQQLGTIIGIVRHQLYVHEKIPFTSHNSSASIEVETSDIEGVIELSRQFLLQNSAIGSDAGLCVAKDENISEAVMEWGKRAKNEILTMEQAHQLANSVSIFLEGITGEKIGVIGSLAAVGLHKEGNDGRFLMLKGKEMREIKGLVTKDELTKISTLADVLEKETFNTL